MSLASISCWCCGPWESFTPVAYPLFVSASLSSWRRSRGVRDHCVSATTNSCAHVFLRRGPLVVASRCEQLSNNNNNNNNNNDYVRQLHLQQQTTSTTRFSCDTIYRIRNNNSNISSHNKGTNNANSNDNNTNSNYKNTSTTSNYKNSNNRNDSNDYCSEQLPGNYE